jgi:hypothetical protein
MPDTGNAMSVAELCQLHQQLQQYLPVWTVCRPTTRDFPGLWSARLHLCLPQPQPTTVVLTDPTLNGVRDKLPPGLTFLQRDVNDDPVIEETWM